MMRTSYIYRILSNIEDACKLTNSRAFQINFAYEHIDTGNSFLSFVTPYFEHVFEVVRFEGEEEDHKYEQSTKLFKS